MNRSLTSLKFCPRILVGPNLVAHCDGPIARRCAPVTLPARLKRNRTFEIAQPRYAGRWILTVIRSIRDIVRSIVLPSRAAILINRLSRSILSARRNSGEGSNACQRQQQEPGLIRYPFCSHKHHFLPSDHRLPPTLGP